MKHCKILFKFATRSRPQKCIEGVKNLIAHLKNKKDYLIFISADTDDHTMYNKQFMRKLAPVIRSGNVVIHFDKSDGKIHAINRDMDMIDNILKWDIVVHITDFMEFQAKGFDNTIREGHGDNEHGVVTFPAINQNGYERFNIVTLPRTTYDRFGYIYKPTLHANFYIEELVARVGSYSMIQIPFFYYRHPKWFYDVPDQLMKDNILYWNNDLQVMENIYSISPHHRMPLGLWR